ncbi:anti-sigma factor family protein [Leptolyngbya sp. AN02str]|uniref:anti-sigma factor family protein n=1 Tax=Leptolyngbya sp. AN02str TaxID=3423363 RepID=UPI003D318D9E
MISPDYNPNRVNGSPLNEQSTDMGHSSMPDMMAASFARDRFELLSAYMDGEVTAAERRQVEEWLDTDPKMQQLHARLLKLRQTMGSFAMAQPTSVDVDAVVDQVMERIERRPKRMAKWGGMAIAAMLIGAISTVLSPASQQFSGQFAQSSMPSAEADGLMIALDRPLIDIPEDGTKAMPSGKVWSNIEVR